MKGVFFIKNFNYSKKYYFLFFYFLLLSPLAVYLVIIFSKNSDYLSSFNNWLVSFTNLPVNNWYLSIFSGLGIDPNNLFYIYPLLMLYIFLFNLVFEIFALIPKLALKLIHKMGGGNSYE